MCYLEYHLGTFMLPANLTCYCRGWVNPGVMAFYENRHEVLESGASLNISIYIKFHWCIYKDIYPIMLIKMASLIRYSLT